MISHERFSSISLPKVAHPNASLLISIPDLPSVLLSMALAISRLTRTVLDATAGHVHSPKAGILNAFTDCFPIAEHQNVAWVVIELDFDRIRSYAQPVDRPTKKSDRPCDLKV
jgi:hypothetical protein